MRFRWLAVAWVAVLVFSSHGWSAEPIDLKVLYAGDPKSDRTADFRSFLEKHFAGLVWPIISRFGRRRPRAMMSSSWTGRTYHRGNDERLGVFKHPALDQDYDRPTILIGGGTLGVGEASN